MNYVQVSQNFRKKIFPSPQTSEFSHFIRNSEAQGQVPVKGQAALTVFQVRAVSVEMEE